MRILVVDDQKRFAENVKKALVAEGYAVDTAYTGEEGERLAGEFPYDLIILDIKLPDKDGLDVCRSLRQQKIATPVLMLTGKDATEDKVQGLDSGADDYLTKPFVLPELFARVRALLRRERSAPALRLQAGDLILDTATRQVWCAGEPVDVKGKEYSVLEYLMRHPGVVITRQMIEQHIEDLTLETGYNMVDVYICKLRTKLDKAGEESRIETVRGAGYRLRVR